MIKNLLLIFIIIGLLFPQKTYEFTEEEVQSLYGSIQELEQNSSRDSLNINNLNEQIQMYIQQTEIDSGIIENYKEQLAIQEEMIKTIKPAWYDNKYLWYSMGIASMIVPIWAVGQIK